MSTQAENQLSMDEFERLREQLSNLKLTDAQITDLALILKDKLDENSG